jgi:nicotinamidase/pyrazinamidase
MPVYATRDWHPPATSHFKEYGGVWPPHCVQGTPGAELYSSLDRSRIDYVVDVGSGQTDEGYSGFEKSDLAEILRRHDIDAVTVVGLATDYCVRATALDALREGFRVAVDREGVRGIDVEPGDSERALEEIRAAGGTT